MSDPRSEIATEPLARRYVSGGAILLGGVLSASTIWMCREFIIDDSLISLHYVANLLQGSGLVFNPGEYTEGFTNLGHVLAVAALGACGIDLVLAARLIGVAGGILAVIYGPAAILPDADEQRVERGVARLLLLSNFFFVYLSYSGMETGLYVGLICLACHRFKQSGDSFGWLVGLLAGSLFVVRPDGALFGAALLGLALLTHGVRRVGSMPGTWVWLGVILAVEAFRFNYYGALVPNTALIKGAASNSVASALPWYGTVGDDVVELLSQGGGVAMVFFALIGMVRHWSSSHVRLAVAMCATAGVFEVYAGGDWMLGYRFLQPLLPFYYCLVVIGCADVLRALQHGMNARLLHATAAATLLIVAISNWSTGLDFRFHAGDYPNSHMTSVFMIPAAEWIGEHFPPSYQIAAASIGALGYYSGLVVIDTLGLTDSHIARVRQERELFDAYLEERNPELIMVSGDLQPRPERIMYGRPYQIARLFRRGTEPTWLLYVRADLPEAERTYE